AAEEKAAGIEAWRRWKRGEEPAAPDLTRGMRSGNLTDGVRSEANLIPRMRSEGADLIRGRDLTSSVDRESGGATHYTEPDNSNPKTLGADAPADATLFSGDVPSVGTPSPSKGTSWKPSSADIDKALAAYKEAASQYGFLPCRALTDERRERLRKRLQDIKSVDAFKLALSALPTNDFLMGRVPPREGQKPFRLDLDRLLSTKSGM